MDCSIDLNKSKCNCSYPGCERKGKCCDCVTYHRDRGELPACYFDPEPEATYDRSIANFISRKMKELFPRGLKK